jgi:hypothetical protein
MCNSRNLAGSQFVQSITLILVFSGLFALSANAQQKTGLVAIEGSAGQWYAEGAERAGDARIAEFLGRQSLWLRNSTQIMRAGIEFIDGTIEFDVAPMDKGNFVGIIFRRVNFGNHENIYLRLHRSGLYNAVQYAPRINGSPTWQLYPDFNAVAEFPRNQWTHVRVEVRATEMEMFVNNQAKPVLVVSRLRGTTEKGMVSFWGRVNLQPTEWAAAVSNISIRPANPVKMAAAVPPAPPEGTLISWEVAAPVQTEKGSVKSLPQIKEWRAAEAEESGLINLNRALKTNPGRWTAFARTTVKTNGARTALLELGYSDDVTVFLNGEVLYSGINGFESRHPEYMGFVKPEYENVVLKLRTGNNELVLAVTEDQKFGWGFIARLKEKE